MFTTKSFIFINGREVKRNKYTFTGTITCEYEIEPNRIRFMYPIPAKALLSKTYRRYSAV